MIDKKLSALVLIITALFSYNVFAVNAAAAKMVIKNYTDGTIYLQEYNPANYYSKAPASSIAQFWSNDFTYSSTPISTSANNKTTTMYSPYLIYKDANNTSLCQFNYSLAVQNGACITQVINLGGAGKPNCFVCKSSTYDSASNTCSITFAVTYNSDC